MMSAFEWAIYTATGTVFSSAASVMNGSEVPLPTRVQVRFDDARYECQVSGPGSLRPGALLDECHVSVLFPSGESWSDWEGVTGSIFVGSKHVGELSLTKFLRVTNQPFLG